MAINFGLTETGFLAPTYDEILDSVEDDFIQSFGQDIVLTSNSNFGIIARLIAWRETLLIQTLQKEYYSAFISTATNSSLDRLGANLGLPRKVEMPSSVNLQIQTDDQYLVQAGEKFETEDGIVFSLTKDVLTAQDTNGNWIGIGELESDETGEMNNVPAGSITIVSNPNDDIISVTNPQPAAGGQDREEDEEYRARLILENADRPGPTAAGIKSALMNLPGVRQVGIVENPSNQNDASGNPAYSVHIYVLGGQDEDIADCLANHIAAGITLDGTKAIDVNDAAGNTRTINFDSGTDLPIYVSVDITANEQFDADEGADSVKEAIINYINQLEMGDSVFLTKLYPPVYVIPGVEEAKIQIGLAMDKLASDDIKCSQFEAPSCEADHIEVTVNGV